MRNLKLQAWSLLPNPLRAVLAKAADVLIPQSRFHESWQGSMHAYRQFNQNYPDAEREFHAEMIGRAVDFGYVSWPRRIQRHIRDKDMLDIGCGTGMHGIGYLVVGVKSYTGMDPRVRLDSGRAKNVRTRQWENFGWTPQEIMKQFSRVKIVPGTSEDFQSGETFDIAVLHNVTEHLLQIEQVVESAAHRLRPDGRIIYHHHNFYSWNGHHMTPKTVDDIDPENPEQKKYVDWAHIRFQAPEGHYLHYGLNKITLDALKALTERNFEIEIWDEIRSTRNVGGGRLTEDIVARFPELTRRELEVHNVFCVARKKAN